MLKREMELVITLDNRNNGTYASEVMNKLNWWGIYTMYGIDTKVYKKLNKVLHISTVSYIYLQYIKAHIDKIK